MQDKKIERKLTSGEITLLKTVFRSTVPYEKIRILNHDPDDETNTRSFHEKGKVHLLGGDYVDDISKSAEWESRFTLVHEVAHFWQYSNTDYRSKQDANDNKYKQKKYDAWIAQVEIEREIKYKVRELPKEDRDGARAYLKGDFYKKKLDSLKGVQLAAHQKVAVDKKTYRRAEGYDPIIPSGPYEEDHIFQQDINFGGANPQGGLPLFFETESTNKPIPGERLSDFLWRNPVIQRTYGTKETLRYHMSCIAQDDPDNNNPSIDYNYMMMKPGSIGFFDLRREAQAELIAEYYLVMNGVDPRTISFDVLLTRPPLSFYQRIIPFVANPVKD